MTEGDGDQHDEARRPRGVPRRAVLGGALTAAAAGIVGYEVGAAGATADDDGAGTGAPAEASAVAVVPKGELVADDVQAALVDVYGRTSALARLEDLRVAYELVDDFPPSAGTGRVGALGWTPVASGAGAAVEPDAPLEGGVVRLVTGTTATGRAGLHLGLDQHEGAPVFTMQWRLRHTATVDPDEPSALVFGALASIDADPTGPEVGPAVAWVHDPARSPKWICRVVVDGEVTDVDSKRVVDDRFHRFTIASDGDGLARFTFDDAEVASVPVDKEGRARYGQGIVLAKTAGTSPRTVELDWFYLRRELPR